MGERLTGSFPCIMVRELFSDSGEINVTLSEKCRKLGDVLSGNGKMSPDRNCESWWTIKPSKVYRWVYR